MPCGLLSFVVVHAAVDGAVLRSGDLSKRQKLGITTAAGWGWGSGVGVGWVRQRWHTPTGHG